MFNFKNNKINKLFLTAPALLVALSFVFIFTPFKVMAVPVCSEYASDARACGDGDWTRGVCDCSASPTGNCNENADDGAACGDGSWTPGVCDCSNIVFPGSPSSPSSQSGVSNAAIVCGAGFTNNGGVCVPDSPFSSGGLAGSTTIVDLISKVLKALLFLSGLVAVIVIIVGGFWYITSAGNEEQAEKGRKALTNAIIGLVVVILAYAIVTILTNLLTTGPGGGATTDTNNTTTKRPGVNDSY